MIRSRRTRLTLVLMLAIGLLAACSTKPSPAHVAYVIGQGGGDANTIKKIVLPGETSGDQGDDRVVYVPAGPRNFIVAPASQENGCRADSCDKHTGTTGTGPDGAPRLPVSSWNRANMTINRNIDVLTAFWPLCEKYGCGTDNQGEVESDSNYAPEGWVDFLDQTHKYAQAEAFRTAIAKFPPSVWQDESQWPAVAEAMSDAYGPAMRAATSLDVDVFCGQSITDPDNREVATCTPVKFTIDAIDPPPAVKDAQAALSSQQSDLTVAEGERELITQRRSNADALYGPEAGKVLGTLDTIKACQEAGQACTVIVGSGAGVTVPAG